MKLRLSSLPAPSPAPNDANPRLPRTSGQAPSRIFAALVLVLGVAGGAFDAGAAPKATPTPTPSPTPTATATPTATPAATPNYSGTQQAQYIATARDAFVALRNEKSQPFLDAHKAMDAAGGLSARGLKSKADIAARRELIAKTSAANEEYLTFVKTQEDTYRAELAKTPLIAGDVDGLVKEFGVHANTPVVIQLREDERDVLKIGDDALATLDKKFGAWTVSDAGKITFKKPADAKAYSKAIANQGAKVAEIDKLRAQLTATPSPSPAASPTGAPGAAPTASPAASAAPAASAKP